MLFPIKHHRRGFTLIELLTVVFVIALLLALLLPAAQQAREAARRTMCASSLKNIGLAIHQHADAHGTFPAGSGSRAGESYLVRILPYLEQRALYDAINFEGRSVESNDNGTAIMSLPSVFLCPSDSWRSAPLASVAPNYAGNAGRNSIRGEGVFIGRPLSPRDITDGLSQTVGVSEWVVGPGFIASGPESFNLRNGHRLGSAYSIMRPIDRDDFDTFARLCRELPPRDVQISSPGYKGMIWIAGSLGWTQYNHTLPPNQPSCFAPFGHFQATTAGSFHGGGANALLMDGGVRFVKESIDPHVWTAVGSRSGGEIVAGDALDRSG